MVRLDSVGLRYGDGPEILKDVSFHLRPGSLCFLTGPSGAGKTSLLRLLFLALKPTRGIINIFEKGVSQVSRWEQPLLRRRVFLAKLARTLDALGLGVGHDQTCNELSRRSSPLCLLSPRREKAC